MSRLVPRVDHQDGHAPDRGRDILTRAGLRQAEPRGEVEGAAPAQFALDPDPPAHHRDQSRREGQAEPGPLVVPGKGGVGLGEGLEDPPPISGGDADAGVEDAKCGGPRRRRPPYSPPRGRLASFGELDGVADQVRDDLPEGWIAHQAVGDASAMRQASSILWLRPAPHASSVPARSSSRSKATGSRSSLPGLDLDGPRGR